MIRDVVLATVHEKQVKNYTCGAACINMVLSQWGKSQAQWAVWSDIQANTIGSRPLDAYWVDGSFASQLCDQCSKDSCTDTDGQVYGDYRCWFTSPEAMVTTINAASPSPLTLDYIANGPAALHRIADSISLHQVPAVLTTSPSLHWVVAVGIQYDDVLPTSVGFENWGSNYLTGFYVGNPDDPAMPQGTIHMVTPPGLIGASGLLMRIECGTHKGACPIVSGIATTTTTTTGGSDGAFDPKVVASPALGIIKWLLAWLDPRRYRRYWVRPRPGPPPKS